MGKSKKKQPEIQKFIVGEIESTFAKKQTPHDLDPFLANLGLKNAVSNSLSQNMNQEISINEIAQNLKKNLKKIYLWSLWL